MSVVPAGLRQWKSNASWLYGAELGSRVVSFLIMPIWSAHVDPEEYSRWILALTATEMLLEVSGLGLASFLTKVLYRYRDERSDLYFGMGGAVVLGCTALLAGAMALGSRELSRLMIGEGVRPDLFLFLAIYVWSAQFSRLATLYLEARIRYRACFVLRLFRVLFGTGFLLVLIVVYRQGFYSWVWSGLATEVLLLPFSVYYLRKIRWGWFNPRMLRFALRFSLPSLITNFLGWGQSRVGRYVLSFSGLGAGVGLYGVAQSISQQYGGLTRPAKIVALRIMGHNLEDDANSPYFLELFHGYICVVLTAAFLTALFLGDLMKLFVAVSYHRATLALPPLIFTLFLEEFYSLYHALMFRYFKVWFHLFALLVSFPSVVLATIVLVPSLGFLGAALAQLIGGLAMVIFAHWYASRVSRRPYRFGEKIIYTLGAILLASVAEAMDLSLVSKAALALIGLTLYLLLHWWRREELFPLTLCGVSAPESSAAPTSPR